MTRSFLQLQCVSSILLTFVRARFQYCVIVKYWGGLHFPDAFSFT